MAGADAAVACASASSGLRRLAPPPPTLLLTCRLAAAIAAALTEACAGAHGRSVDCDRLRLCVCVCLRCQHGRPLVRCGVGVPWSASQALDCCIAISALAVIALCTHVRVLRLLRRAAPRVHRVCNHAAWRALDRASSVCCNLRALRSAWQQAPLIAACPAQRMHAPHACGGCCWGLLCGNLARLWPHAGLPACVCACSVIPLHSTAGLAAADAVWPFACAQLLARRRRPLAGAAASCVCTARQGLEPDAVSVQVCWLEFGPSCALQCTHVQEHAC